MTGWAMLGLEAAGINPRDVSSGGETPVDYLEENAGRLQSVGDLERTVLALEGAGLDAGVVRRAATSIAQLRKHRDADGSVDGQVNLTAFYVLALRSAGVPAGDLGKPAKWLRAAQSKSGGWGIQPQAPPESDSTGAVLQALAAVGGSGPALEDGVRYLRKAQTGNGGFAIGSSGVVNSQSTAWAIQGLVAAGAGGDTLDKAERLHGLPPRRRRPLPLLGLRATRPRSGSRRRRSWRRTTRRSRLPCSAAPRPRRRTATPRRSCLARRRRSPILGGLGGRAFRLRRRVAVRRLGWGAGAADRETAAGRSSGEEKEGAIRPAPEASRAAVAPSAAEPTATTAAVPVGREPGRGRRGDLAVGGRGVRRAGARARRRVPLVPEATPLEFRRFHRRWTSRPRSATAARTRPTGRSPSRARCSTSCSSSRAGRRTTT